MKKPNKLRLVRLMRFSLIVLLVVLHWSFVPHRTDSKTSLSATFSYVAPFPGNGFEYNKVAWSLARMAVYDSLNLEDLGLSRRVFQMALRGMEKLKNRGLVKEDIISIVDFSKPSSQKRLFVIDLNNIHLLFNTLVAHGKRSGKDMASVFSNKMSSNKSSLGFYVTGQPYFGSNGYSLKLQGVEKGINDFAQKRAIVLHGADYVSENWVSSQGYLGRSQGCPAVPVEVNQQMIDDIKDGTCLFIYHPTTSYSSRSKLVRQ